jgi:hypothetical protein
MGTTMKKAYWAMTVFFYGWGLLPAMPKEKQQFLNLRLY